MLEGVAEIPGSCANAGALNPIKTNSAGMNGDLIRQVMGHPTVKCGATFGWFTPSTSDGM